MKKQVLLLGGSGFIGKELGVLLHTKGYLVRVISRNNRLQLPYPAICYTWEKDGSIPTAALNNIHAVVNLAGEPIATGRWSKNKKKRIITSRLETAKALLSAIAKTDNEVSVVIQASAIGFYGSTGEQVVDERTKSGEGFLAETAQKWEETLKSLPSEKRCVILRLGMVLGKEGGAFPFIKKIYTCGLGASLGSGQQYLSWIHSDDVCQFVLWALENSTCRGSYNVTAPRPVTYDSFHHTIAKSFSFSWPIRVPAWFLHLVLGEKATLLTTSQRVIPERALHDGYKFKFTRIEDAIAALLTPHT